MNQSILCVGECLIDFFSHEANVSLKKSQTFIKKAGGAPANVCAAISKLGGEAIFLGKVGADPFGDFLEETLQSVGVHTNLLVKDSSSPTTLAFVSLGEDGQRDFVFNRGADANLTLDEIPLEIVGAMKIIHFGSATALLTPPFNQTYKEIFTYAKNNRCFISFDPNFRTNLWQGREEEFIKIILNYIPHCDFLKVSDEELFLLTKEDDIQKAVSILHRLGANCIAVTLGKDGTFLSYSGESSTISSIPIKAIDTTGAGDAFVGATLYQLSKLEHPKSISFTDWKTIIHFSNKVGAMVCEKMGAIEAIPSLEEVLSR
ncbi:carbohydrate kinase family protein [Lysinibacillus telephonicus]|uniref:carbohydrate kinase family protein n=1 Tax=Lysinibacillus telephonicus TaxID=1714840 RepID=UPI003BA337A8